MLLLIFVLLFVCLFKSELFWTEFELSISVLVLLLLLATLYNELLSDSLALLVISLIFCAVSKLLLFNVMAVLVNLKDWAFKFNEPVDPLVIPSWIFHKFKYCELLPQAARKPERIGDHKICDIPCLYSLLILIKYDLVKENLLFKISYIF